MPRGLTWGLTWAHALCSQVLDEADRMVERGFLQQVSKVKNHIRPGHQTLMFSATIPEDLGNVRMLRDGHAVVDVVGKAMGAQTNAQVEQKALLVRAQRLSGGWGHRSKRVCAHREGPPMSHGGTLAVNCRRLWSTTSMSWWT